ncbi:chemotaxis response regulator protein-glutamate methylesterase of group 3 operon [Leptospira kobayashii]|uniref:Protein-glutamate methylesterase/protein-glutamine glutaminase n=1 Tax=Leptospira kobayashii TaxID=1917830 RepID=A0ABM7UJM8_9LEPT|nr:chemotaxis response regulator protein-glutamate methylesterase [Leptospira kobayashii]BDA79016.1 chemotaxis response regulator protein-glutamate methylesterase of group 3 operon [Leptospira kobayashii]
MKKIKVFVIDDSAVVRQVLGDLFTKDSGFEFLGAAVDPIFAMDKMAANWPDVIILDIEMPRMDGISFLKKIMKERPTPVVICSTLTEEGSDIAMTALSLGAAEIITKPKIGLKDFLNESSLLLTDSVLAASHIDLGKMAQYSFKEPEATKQKLVTDISQLKATEKIVAIGTSTGGTIALEEVLVKLTKDKCPGIVIVQHMPEKFTEAFAKRLNSVCEIEVREGKDGDRILPGLALIAPGNKHMQVKRSGAQYHIEVSDGPLVNRHKPSVDVLFRSVAKYVGQNAKGIIMTGMGDDGAQGLLEMKQAGAVTVAQNEESCIVFGMPKEAIRRGAADKILPLRDIHRSIIDFYN